MPTYINVGRADYNLGGNTSKGYIISISGKTVSIKFGSIHCKSRRYFWAGVNLPQRKVTEFKTLDEAKLYLKDKIRRIENQNYSKLQSGTTIYMFKKFNPE